MTKTDTPTLDNIIEANLDKTEDQIIDAIFKRRDLKRLIAPSLRWRITTILRRHTRRVETEVAEALKDATGKDRVAVRRMLAEETFITTDGRTVLWLDATADEHEARAGWFGRQSDSLLETADRHLEAAADIRRTRGATCLRDMDKVPA